MATKLTRQTLLQFGAGANPASEIGQFGGFQTLLYGNSLSLLQSGTAWNRGWYGETINTNRPFIQDMNAVDFVFGYMLAYLFQQGIPEYDSATFYFLNSICQIAGQIYISLQDNNQGNPPGTSPASWQAGLPGSELTGVVKAYAGVVAPGGYLLCNGQAVSRSTYAALFNICGINYGSGDGSTTFNVPDLRTRIPVGLMAGDPNFGALGQVGGEETHILTVPEMPSHSHPFANLGNPGSTGPNTFFDNLGSSQNTGNAGGDQPHNNLQPYVTMNYIIKT